jgi:ATP-dependent DNA helicase RecQ
MLLPSDIDVALWEALRDCRRGFAEEQNVPPYVIFHDSTLQEMCVLQPATLERLAEVSGVGERKLEKYGPAFVSVIINHLA